MRSSMVLVLSRIAAILLVVTFVAAGVAKLIRYPRWRDALNEYELPPTVAAVIATGVPVAELAVAGVMLMLSQQVGAAVSLALLALFSAAIARVAVIKGRRVPCGCFGGNKSRDFRLLLARNAVLCAAAAVLLFADSDASLVASVDGSDVVPALLVAAGVAVVAWLATQMATSLRGRPR